MSDSMFSTLLSMVDKRTVGEVASALGQPETAVTRGLESSLAATLGGLASKAEDPGALRRILDVLPAGSQPVSFSQIASGLTDPNSSLMALGKRLMPALFGNSENAVTSAISRDSGLSLGSISSLLCMAGPIVMSFISKRVRDGGLTMGGLGTALQRESATIKSALPAGISAIFWPGTAKVTSTVSPVVAQAVQKESSFNWLPVLAIAALGMGTWWFLNHSRQPTVSQIVPSVPVGSANRFAIPTPKTTCTMPADVNLPEGGAAARLLALVQKSGDNPVGATWLDVDRISFDTGSAKLRSESQAQINNIASVLKNCPGVRLEIAGYTDNAGTVEANRRLSRNRANNVVSQLVSQGVSPNRLTAEGYGEESPVADNSIEAGRAQNRRVAMRVAQP